MRASPPGHAGTRERGNAGTLGDTRTPEPPERPVECPVDRPPREFVRIVRRARRGVRRPIPYRVEAPGATLDA